MTSALDRLINQPVAPVAASSSGGSGFGITPVVPPEMMQHVADTLQGLVYSVPAGGFLSGLNPWTGKPPTAADYDANSAYMKFGPLNANAFTQKYGVSDPAANARAQSLYNYLGSLPTRNVGTAALEKLYQRTGFTSPLQPSFNERLGKQGLGPYGGPWETPLWRGFRSY